MKRLYRIVLVIIGIGMSLPAADGAVGSMNTMLESVITAADRVRVRSGGTCHRVPPEEVTLAEISGSAELLELFKLLAVNEQAGFFSCSCCGNPSLEFYKGNQLLAVLGMHHGRAVRWAGSYWPGDGLLLNGRGLVEFLAEHGVKEPREELDRYEQWQKQLKDNFSAWEAETPEILKPVMPQIARGIFQEQYHALMKKAYKDRDERLRALLRWYGSGLHLWAMHVQFEYIPALMLRHYSTFSLVKALNAEALKTMMEQEDTRADADKILNGAALYFSNYVFLDKHQQELQFVPDELRIEMLESAMRSSDGEFFDRIDRVLNPPPEITEDELEEVLPAVGD